MLRGIVQLALLERDFAEQVEDLELFVGHAGDELERLLELRDGHVEQPLLAEAQRQVVQGRHAVLGVLLRDLELLDGLVQVVVLEILEPQLVAQVLVVGIALHAVGDVVEDVLVARRLLGRGALGVPGFPQGRDLGVELRDRDAGEAAVEFGVGAHEFAGLFDGPQRLVVALLLVVEPHEVQVVVDVLRLGLDLLDRLGDERLRVVRRLDHLALLLQLGGLLLVGERAAVVAVLAGLLPSGVEGAERLAVLEHRGDGGVVGLRAVGALQEFAGLAVVLHAEVELAQQFHDGQIAGGQVLADELRRHEAVIRMPRLDRGFREQLHEGQVQRIDEQELLAFDEGLFELARLDERLDLHRLEGARERGEAVRQGILLVRRLEPGDLRQAQISPRRRERRALLDAPQEDVDRDVRVVALQRGERLAVEIADALRDLDRLRRLDDRLVCVFDCVVLVCHGMPPCDQAFTWPALAIERASTLWISAKPCELTGLSPSLASIEASASK